MADLNYAGIVLPDGNSYQTAGEYVPYSSTVSTPISDASVQNLAPEYDPTSTYSVKDWCVYNGVLYQCNTAIATPEAFDATKWTAKKVVDMTGEDIPVSSGATETIAEALNFSSQTVTIPTYGGTLICRKIGRIVSLVAWGIGSTSVYTSGSKLVLSGIIPQEYRPNDEEYVYGAQTGSEAGTTSALYVLKNNGNIETYAYSNIGSGKFSISYIV